MDNKKICGFINSKDVRKHLIDIGYEFSVPEYAYLIWQNRRLTLKEKHAAWNELIDETETCTINTSYNNVTQDLHSFIKKYIAVENKMVFMLKRQETNCFYIVEEFEDGEWCGDEECSFTNYKSAYSYAKGGFKEGTPYSFRIRKRYIDDSRRKSGFVEARYNSEGDMIEVFLWGRLDDALDDSEYYVWSDIFHSMWFDIPIPFEPGDIVCDNYLDSWHNGPFVISTTVPWDRREHPNKKEKSTNQLCLIDMNACGYSVKINTCSVKYLWLEHLYLNLEYYKGSLDKEKRILLAYSMFKKGEINGDTLSKLSQIITAEHIAEKIYNNIDWNLSKDTLKLFDIEKYKS